MYQEATDLDTNYFSAMEEVSSSSSDENYYANLELNTYESRYYESLKFPTILSDSTENDSLIAELIQKDEMLNRQAEKIPKSLYFYLEKIEKNVVYRFQDKIKTHKMKHCSMDQTIEEVFDEINYENKLEELLKGVAFAQLVSKQKESHFNDNPNEMKKINDEFSEIPFLVHAFSLAKFSDIKEILRKHKSISKLFATKMARLLSYNTDKIVISVANVFMCLLNLEFDDLLKNFNLIPMADKWNVLKNLIYYSVKITLIEIAQLFFTECGEDAFGEILNSIFNYVKNFQRLKMSKTA